MKTVAEKLGMKPDHRSIFIDEPEKMPGLNSSEVEAASALTGMFDYIHLFVEKAAVMDKRFPQPKKNL